jgi:hypothetical protein
MPRIIVLLALVASHFALARADDHRAWDRVDAWYDPPADTMTFVRGGVMEMNRAKIHEVAESHQKEAIELLRDASCVLVSDEAASVFLGGKLPEHASERFYLVRAVRLNPLMGSFSVRELEGQLLVQHDSLGRSLLPMKREALLLQLKNQPKRVFVTCGMAE